MFTLFAVFISNSVVAEWTFMFTSKNEIKFYVDYETIRKSGNMAKMWGLWDYRYVESSERLKWYSDYGITEVLSSKKLTEFDCRHDQFRTLYAVNYSESMGTGQIINIHDTASDWMPTMPGSVSESLWKIACE
jgi:hypothetical protein